MKKIIFIFIVTLAFSSQSIFAQSAKRMAIMAHVNPMPNYVSLVTKHSEQLKLTKAQKAKLMDWKKEHGATMALMAEAVLKAESELKEASYNGAPLHKIKKMAKGLMEKRTKIIVSKTKCRNFMMKTLNKSQWNKVKSILKAKS